MTSRTGSETVTHESMSKHDSKGENIAIHSLSIHPAHRKNGYAKKLIEELQFRCQHTITPKPSRMILISHKPLVPFYESLGFKNLGPSECKFGDETWYDMTHKI